MTPHPTDLVDALEAEVRARVVRPPGRLDLAIALVVCWLLRWL